MLLNFNLTGRVFNTLSIETKFADEKGAYKDDDDDEDESEQEISDSYWGKNSNSNN